jgi:Rad3-related DNA helicase
LLTPGIRKSIGLDLFNSIIVIDESHNIEKCAEMALSYKLKFKVLNKA